MPASRPRSSLPSPEIAGFEVTDTLYTSSLSRVYRAKREQDGLPVVLKILNKDFPSPRELARYRREYEITSSLNLPGTIRVHDELIPYENTLIMVLEDFGGESLARQLISRSFPVFDFLRLALRIVEILRTIHDSSIIHKDIGPPNIVWNPETDVVKLIDFGISTRIPRETARSLHPEHLEGTLRYISPEQTGRMNRAVDNRSDLYSLGATFFHMLTGRPPFDLDDPLDLVHAHIARVPEPGSAINSAIPEVLSEILSRLMAKTPEERYQSAFGLKADLERCLADWQENGDIKPFRPGERDVPDRFYFPQRLYGRDEELKRLKAALVAADRGGREFLLFAGYSGVGKTSLVGELRPAVADLGGYYLSGKFDQYKKNIPYMAFLEALQDFIAQVLTERPEQIADWKKRLGRAIGRAGSVVVDVIPEVELVVGAQPPVPALGPTETQNRFEQVMGDFILALGSRGRPVVIFLDDLHWADSASLRLILRVMKDPNAGGLLLLGAYRDNEVNEFHPLIQTLEKLKQRNSNYSHAELAPLDLEQVTQLAADTVHLPPAEVRSLATILFEKTHGNPFFASEFLRSLYRDGVLKFDGDRGRWHWDEGHISRLGITENVADLMAGSIAKLSPAGLQVIQLAACVGSAVSLDILAIALNRPRSETRRLLDEVLVSGLILPIGDDYKYADDADGEVLYRFLHDRVQQAAYHSMDEDRRVEVHLMVGRFMRDARSFTVDEHIFTIVNHLNKGIPLLTDQAERLELARLNLKAGRRARLSVAYQPAADYLEKATRLLPADPWRECSELTLEITIERAETDFLLSEYDRAEAGADEAIANVPDVLQQCRAYEIKIRSLHARGDLPGSIFTAIDALALLGISIDKNPSLISVLKEFLSLQILIRRRGRNYPAREVMRNADMRAAMGILANIGANSYSLNANIFALSAFQMIRLSYLHGNSPYTPFGLSLYAVALTGLHLYGEVDRVQTLAETLLEQAEDRGLMTRPTMVLGTIVHWNHPARRILAYMERAVEFGLETGDVEYVGYSYFFQGMLGFFVGDEIPALYEKLKRDHASLIGFEYRPVDVVLLFWSQVLQNLRGETEAPHELDGELFPRSTLIAEMEKMNYTVGIAMHTFGQAMLLLLFKHYDRAHEQFARLEKLEEAITGMRLVPYQKLLHSLSLLAMARKSSGARRRRYIRAVRPKLRLVRRWVRVHPKNNQAIMELILAEIARTRGRDAEAIKQYDAAIKKAKESGFHLEFALANELAGEFYLELDNEQVAYAYLAAAHYAYEQWGAIAKMRHLEAVHPKLLTVRTITTGVPGPEISSSLEKSSRSTTEDEAWTLDLHAVMKASRSISREIDLAQLLDRLMNIVLVNAGAERGMLLLETDGVWRIEAEAGKDEGDVRVLVGRPVDEDAPLSLGVFHYVLRTERSLFLDNSARDPRFGNDPYIQANQTASLFCLPLLNRKRLIGILYLENNLTAGVFNPERLEILHLLSSQIAVALENATLFKGLQDEIQRRIRLEETRRTQSEIIAKLNHELQIPVLGILANLESMESNLKRESTALLPEKIARAKNYCLYLKTLIHNMIYSSASEFRDPFYVAPEESGELDLCYQTAAALVRDIHDGEFVDVLPPPVLIACPEPLLVIVLVNVLGNCAEHSHRFHIKWAEEDDSIVLHCENELVAPLDTKGIFEKWSSSRRDGIKPILGLGLYIARSIMEQIGGQLTAHQESGRFFLTMRLPVTSLAED